MTWQYEVEWYPGGDESSQSRTNVILVESKPRNLGTFGLIDVRMWTSSETGSSGDSVSSTNPIVMYVQVLRGTAPSWTPTWRSE
jgi:hypothetical protein